MRSKMSSQTLAGISGALAIAFGAFGFVKRLQTHAIVLSLNDLLNEIVLFLSFWIPDCRAHALKSHVDDPKLIAAFQTGAHYHLAHRYYHSYLHI